MYRASKRTPLASPKRPAPVSTARTGAVKNPMYRGPAGAIRITKPVQFEKRRTITKHVPMDALPVMNGLDRALASVEVDPPIFEQKLRFDAPSLTLYMGTNKVALIPALLSALAVKLILFGGSKVSQTFAGAPSRKASRA